MKVFTLGLYRNLTKAKANTNHDGVKATAIMLGSIAAISSGRSPVIAVEQAPEITSDALRGITEELALISFPMRRMEGHISTAAEFYGAVILSNLRIAMNSTVVHS